MFRMKYSKRHLKNNQQQSTLLNLFNVNWFVMKKINKFIKLGLSLEDRWVEKDSMLVSQSKFFHKINKLMSIRLSSPLGGKKISWSEISLLKKCYLSKLILPNANWISKVWWNISKCLLATLRKTYQNLLDRTELDLHCLISFHIVIHL
jgi:hypothetical protein